MCFNFYSYSRKIVFYKIYFTYSFEFLYFFSAFSTRLFSVLRFESVIHEFDP